MKLKVFAVRDDAAGAFLQPFFMVNDVVAIRSFRNSVRDPQHNFSINAEDYSLVALAEWDEETGHFLDLPSGPEVIAFAVEQLTSQEQ